ncbi:MAG TPA: zinc-binding dehydrogenase [Spirochaetia bacterium]|nr:zinc-binding dehydrogenase [Spirochaetia bacterium]
MTEIQIVRFGGPEVFRAVQRPAAPLPPDHVRIQVSATGINFADVQMRMGLYPEAPRLPFAPGFEVAGVIAEVGADVHLFRPGERVLAACRFGGYADEIVLPVQHCRRTPRRLSDVEAASIPVSFMTAWIALMEMGRVRDGDKVLVPGAAGGVGSAIVQVAAHAGAQVTGLVGSPEKKDIVRSLGAAHVSTYEEFGEQDGSSRDFDMILDARGGSDLKDSMKRLAPGGRVVSYGVSSLVSGATRSIIKTVFRLLKTPLLTPIGLAMANEGLFGLNMLKLFDTPQGLELLMKALDWTLEGFENGWYRATVGKVFPLVEAGAAHMYLQSRKNTGKIVLRCS